MAANRQGRGKPVVGPSYPEREREGKRKRKMAKGCPEGVEIKFRKLPSSKKTDPE